MIIDAGRQYPPSGHALAQWNSPVRLAGTRMRGYIRGSSTLQGSVPINISKPSNRGFPEPTPSSLFERLLVFFAQTRWIFRH